jgi:segregation and condensation protein B
MDPPSETLPGEESRLQPLIEAMVLASPEPVSVRQLARALRVDEIDVQLAIDGINGQYANPRHGIFLRYTRGGYQIATKPELSHEVRELVRGLRPPAPLSMAGLQTLAIIAYKQPVSAPEIHAIRRVDAPGVIRTLLKRKLIAPAGHRPDGRALLYKTTRLFLTEFGLKDLQDLPALEQFAELQERYLRDS